MMTTTINGLLHVYRQHQSIISGWLIDWNLTALLTHSILYHTFKVIQHKKVMADNAVAVSLVQLLCIIMLDDRRFTVLEPTIHVHCLIFLLFSIV